MDYKQAKTRTGKLEQPSRLSAPRPAATWEDIDLPQALRIELALSGEQNADL